MTIIEEIRNNPEEGAKRLEREYKPRLLLLACRLCPDQGDAEELVNRTIAETVVHIDSRLVESAIYGWMCKILVGCHSKDSRRKSNSEIVYPGTLPDVADEEAHEKIYRDLDHLLVREAVDTLSKDDREILLLHYFVDLPIAKIARFLAIPQGTVMSRLHYARKALAAKLGATVKKTGAKTLLIALAIAALAAAGVAGVAAIRATVATDLMPSPSAGTDPAPSQASIAESGGDEFGWDSTRQTEAIIANLSTNNEENTMNVQSVKSAAVNTLAAFTLAGLTAQANSPDQAISAPVFAQNGLVVANAANADNVWTYDSSTNPKTISNGNWTITLINDYTDIANGAIQLYNITAGSGVLDLRNMTVDGSAITSIKFHSNTGAYATSWKNWDISDFLIDAFDSVAADGHNTLTFGTNPNLKNIEITGGNVTSMDGFASMTGLTNALIRLPKLVKLGNNANSGFYNCTALKKVVLGCPNLTWMGQNIYTGCNSLEGDVGDYIPATVTNFHQNAQYSATSVTGTLVLDNLKSANFQSFAGVSNVKITYTGTNLYNTSPFNGRNVLKDVTYIAPGCTNMLFNGSYVWNNCNSITNVTLYIPKVEAVYRWPSSVKTYWFQNEALSAEIVNGICTFSGTGMRTIATYGTIYCSKRMGWKALATEMTADEEAAAPEGCFGVFKALNSYNQPYGMWMVHRDSPYDKRTGSVYFFR